jgi:hypothetical protein
MTTMTSFRADFLGALKATPVIVSIENDELVVCNVSDRQVRWRFPRQSCSVREINGVLIVDLPSGRVLRVTAEDHDAARQVFGPGLRPVFDDLSQLEGADVQRWQYAVINIGSFNSSDRMQMVLGRAGSQGWELAATMDKQSNWFAGMEKGFLLLKRPVPAGVTPNRWCISVSGR